MVRDCTSLVLRRSAQESLAPGEPVSNLSVAENHAGLTRGGANRTHRSRAGARQRAQVAGGLHVDIDVERR
jgi:hypothetical protein